MSRVPLTQGSFELGGVAPKAAGAAIRAVAQARPQRSRCENRTTAIISVEPGRDLVRYEMRCLPSSRGDSASVPWVQAAATAATLSQPVWPGGRTRIAFEVGHFVSSPVTTSL